MSPNRSTEGAIAHDKIVTTILPRTPKRITRSTINAVPSKTSTQFQLNARAKVFKPLSPKQQQRTRISKGKAHWQRLNLSIDLSLLPQPTINTRSPSPIPASPDDAASQKESTQSEHYQQQRRYRLPTTPDTGDAHWVSALKIFQCAHPSIQDLISGPLFHSVEVARLAALFGRLAAQQEEWIYLARIRRVYYGRFLRRGQRAMGEGVPAGEEGRARLEGWVERAERRVEELALDLGAVYLELRDRWRRWEGGRGEEEEGEGEDFRGRRRCREWVCGAGVAHGEGWTGRVEGGYVDADTGYVEVMEAGIGNGELGDTY